MTRSVTVCFAFALLGLLAGVMQAQEYDPIADTKALVGCLRPDDGSPGFVLEDATVDDASDMGKPMSYDLRGVVPPGIRLADHVGHRVRVLGAITERPSPEERPVMNMHTVEHVAAECS